MAHFRSHFEDGYASLIYCDEHGGEINLCCYDDIDDDDVVASLGDLDPTAEEGRFSFDYFVLSWNPQRIHIDFEMESVHTDRFISHSITIMLTPETLESLQESLEELQTGILGVNDGV